MSNNVFVNDKLTMTSTQSDKSLKRLEVFLRPTEPNEFFRFRLLWFRHEGTSRKVPYIERWVHQVWEDGADGKRKMNEIICPISKHVAENWPGNPWDDCPICNFSNMNFVAFKDSKYTDRAAANNSKTFKRKYDLVIPVYIVSDPCYSNNVGKIRVFRINDSKIGENFKKMLVAKSSEEGAQIFNGGKAVDFIIRMDNVKHEREDGSVWTKNEIVQMGFAKRAYEIPALTPDLVNAFPFDEYFGASPSMTDLKEWHKKYCLHATTDDIDTDELNDMTTIATVASSTTSSKTESAAKHDDFEDEPTGDFETVSNIDDIDGGLADDEDPFKDLPAELYGEDVEDIPVVQQSTKKSATVSTDTDEIDVDNLLQNIGL